MQSIITKSTNSNQIILTADQIHALRVLLNELNLELLTYKDRVYGLDTHIGASFLFTLDQILFCDVHDNSDVWDISNKVRTNKQLFEDEFYEGNIDDNEVFFQNKIFFSDIKYLDSVIGARVNVLSNGEISKALMFYEGLTKLVRQQRAPYCCNRSANIISRWLKSLFLNGHRSGVVKNIEEDSHMMTPLLGIIELGVQCFPTPFREPKPERGQEYINMTRVVNNIPMVEEQYYKPVRDFSEYTSEEKIQAYPDIYGNPTNNFNVGSMEDMEDQRSSSSSEINNAEEGKRKKLSIDLIRTI